MVDVTSEVGRLRTALVHEPGPEVDRMVPAMMDELLFDDILYGERAREEHARFRRVMQLCGVEVLEVRDLLLETLEQAEARHWLCEVALEDEPQSLRRRLLESSADEAVEILVAGLRSDEERPGVEVDELYGVPPLPNWCFQRDPQIVLGNGVVFGSMAAPARYREGLLARVMFGFHPRLSDIPVLFDPIQADREHPLFVGKQRPSLEGGDVLVLSREIVAVGLSERTNRTAIRHMARSLGRIENAPRFMFVVELPRRRAYMHLDTLLTVVDQDACLVYPPVILDGGRELARVWEIDLEAGDLEPSESGPLLDALARRGITLEPIPCGGPDRVTQQREQWTDGANAFALAPGVITLFDRNVRTAEELDRRGFNVLNTEDLLLGRSELNIDAGGRTCILIPSHEISRARGGPHCLVHPLLRDRLPG